MGEAGEGDELVGEAGGRLAAVLPGWKKDEGRREPLHLPRYGPAVAGEWEDGGERVGMVAWPMRSSAAARERRWMRERLRDAGGETSCRWCWTVGRVDVVQCPTIGIPVNRR